MSKVLRIALLAALALGTAPTSADAKSRARGKTVTACSWWGNGCYTAPVRKAPMTQKMRLKGGTWIDCNGDCRRSLREQTVDFWETQNEKALAIH